MKILTYSLTVACASLLLGCASTQVSKTDSIPISAGGQQRTFEIAKVTPSGKEVSQQRIISALIGRFKKDVGDNPHLNYAPQGQTIHIAYQWAMGLNRNFLTADYKVAIEDKGSKYAITLQCPTRMQSEVVDLSITGIPKWDHDNIASKIVASCRNADIVVPFIDEVTAEVNVPFNDVSTFANFRRKLKSARSSWNEYASTTKVTALNIEKSEKFYAPEPYGDSLVSIAVYPYRNGAKVLYAFSYNYTVNSKGTTYSENVIRDMKKSIAAVAND